MKFSHQMMQLVFNSPTIGYHLHDCVAARPDLPRSAFKWVLLIALALFVVPAALAQNCTGTFTITDNGGGTNYNLNSNADRLLINSGTYNGTIGNFASGSQICVNPGATFNPSQINNANGSLTNRGVSTLPNLSLGTGFSFSNLLGTTTFVSNPNFNGQTNFYNATGARVIFISSMQFGGNSTMVNDGTVTFQADFQNQVGSSVTNNNRFDFNGGNLNPSGAFTNNGQVVGAGFININSGSTVINNCSFLARNGFNNNSGNTQNFGFILVEGVTGFPSDLWQNNAAFFQGPNGVVSGKRYINSSPITGGGKYYFEKSAGYAENVHTINQGSFAGTTGTPTVFFDTTQSSAPNIFDVQNINPTNTVRSSFVPPTINDVLTSCSPVFAPQADVSVTKSAPASVLRTGSITYTLVVRNAGPSDVAGISLLDNVPASITGVNWACTANGAADCDTVAAGTGASGSGNAVSLPNIRVSAGASNNVTVVVTGVATVAGTVTNTVSLTLPSNVQDPTTGNNSDTAVTSVLLNALLSIAKSNGVNSVTAGGTTDYLITVSNAGPDAANNSLLKDLAGSGLVCASATCTSTTGGASCPAGLPLGAQVAAADVANFFNGTGLLIPNFPATSMVNVGVSCSVTATGQ